MGSFVDLVFAGVEETSKPPIPKEGGGGGGGSYVKTERMLVGKFELNP